MQALIPVRVRDCACPDTPHPDGDNVYIAPKLPFRGGLVANQQAIDQREAVVRGETNQLQHLWLETFVRYGAVEWDFCDESGPVPFDVEEVLADYSLALPVAEKANDIGYGDAAMAPFLRGTPVQSNSNGKRPRKPSGNGRMRATTSPLQAPIPRSSG